MSQQRYVDDIVDIAGRNWIRQTRDRSEVLVRGCRGLYSRVDRL